jgi:hypothetical protein
MTSLLGMPTGAFDLVGSKTTGGVAEENLDLSLDEGAPAASIAIPDGWWMVIEGHYPTAEKDARFRIEKSVNNGSTWYAIHHWRRPQDGSDGITDQGIIKILGGALVKIRLRVTTPSQAAFVTMTFHGRWVNVNW